MDFDDLDDLGRHWRKSPPQHLALHRIEQILCGFLGVKPSGAPGRPSPATPADLRHLAARLNGAR